MQPHSIQKLVVRPGFSLTGEVPAEVMPGDKSLSHRAALFGALADGESRFENFLISGVTRAMLDALTNLGVVWEIQGKTLFIEGRGLHGFAPPKKPLYCGNSATTLRLLAGALAASGTPSILDGSPGLRSRPMDRIVEPLQAMGVSIEAAQGSKAPLKLGLRSPDVPLSSLDYDLPVASAQVKSCLLLAGLAADGEMVLREPGPSRDHTERMLRSMGVGVESHMSQGADGRPVYWTKMWPPLSSELAPFSMVLPGDFSSASFLIVAALITPGSTIKLHGVGLNPTRTGLLEVLQKMGAGLSLSNVTEQGGEPIGDIVVHYSSLHGLDFHDLDAAETVVRMIDEFPAFAVAASYADGTTLVCEAGELRHKESDRITALCQELLNIGADISEIPDGFIIHGKRKLLGGKGATHGDHRLAMAMAVAGMAAETPVEIEGAGILSESFPEFVPVLRMLGASFEEE